MDLLYIIQDKAPNNWRELRWSLRSVCKYFPGHGKIYIVGGAPPWITGVSTIHYSDANRSPYINVAYKLRHALLSYKSGPSSDFYLMCDDYIMLQRPDKNLRYTTMLDHHIAKRREKESGPDPYLKAMEATYSLLINRVATPMSFVTHTPLPMKACRALAVAEIATLQEHGAELATLYGNLYGKPTTSEEDMMVAGRDVKVKEFTGVIPMDIAVSSSEETEADPFFQQALAKLFPEKCRYEKD